MTFSSVETINLKTTNILTEIIDKTKFSTITTVIQYCKGDTCQNILARKMLLY